MCGIAGVVNCKGGRIENPLLKSMCDCLIHRGPDDEGYYIYNSPRTCAGLGHRRLSIIDLTTGKQPISNEAKDIWVIHNGEIYNFGSLRQELEKKGHAFSTRSDTEVIVHGYEEYQDEVVARLRGAFAFALWDGRQKRLILARDRVGKKPLLYSRLHSGIVFASEFRALLAHPDIAREVNPEAIHHYLTYLCIPAPLTGFKNINKVPAGHMLIYKDGNIEIKKYWDIDFSKKIHLDEDEALERLKDLLTESVNIRLISDVPLGLLLSGGIDSSGVAALMHQLQGEGIHTFSIGFGEGGYNELPYAGIIADKFGADHHEEVVTPDALTLLPELVEHYGEPFGDSSALPTYYVCRAARARVKVALNGDGGDEVFAGYRRHLAGYLAEAYGPLAKAVNRTPLAAFFNLFPNRPSAPNSPGSIRRFLNAAGLDRARRHMRWIGFMEEDLKRRIYTDAFRGRTEGLNSLSILTDIFDRARGLDSIDAILYADTMFGLQSDLVVKMDIASMANSLETRSPLLDHRLMEFAASLPSSLKIRGFTLKYIFKKALRGRVPDEILNRPKRGFAVPVDAWFRGPLRDYLTDTILSKRAMERGYFNPDRLREVVRWHLAGRDNYGQHFWGLLVLELWHRRFIDS